MILKKENVERIASTEATAEKLKALGFKAVVQPREPGREEPGEQKPIEAMTAAELKAMAKEKGIDGAASLTKNELLAVLKDVV